MTSESQVRSAFAKQAEACGRLGSPFTALVCALLAERLDRSTAAGRKVLDWQGEPSAQGDAVPLRLAGALHGLVLKGAVPALAALYPPNLEPKPAALWGAIDAVLHSHDAQITARLDLPPQTNEVGRTGSLMTGLLYLADRFALPFELFELGCSAGLNLNLARFAYDLGGVTTGDPASSVRIAPRWEGPPPPAAKVDVLSTRGVDISPLQVSDPHDRELLTAYVWADQLERLARVRAAIDVALAHPPAVEQGDAADWLETNLTDVKPRVTQVAYHTIAYQYFPPAVQQRIREHLAKVGAAATDAAPLAWLRLEADPEYGNAYSLRLTTWPGEETVIGLGHPHGRNFKSFQNHS